METAPETHYPYSRYLEGLFGARTYKIVVTSGYTCPTRDGTISRGGCAFCDFRGSSSFHGKQGRGRAVQEQILARMEGVRSRFSASKFLAYFQSYTNTYTDDLEDLRSLYLSALETPGIDGLCIGTRPDCLEEPVVRLIEDLAREHYVSVELGVQSFEDRTLDWLTRGHHGQCSVDAFRRLRKWAPHAHTCAHLIFGSPTDSARAPRDAALILNDLGVTGAKLHQLMVLKNTELARRFLESPFPTLSLERYGNQVIDFLEHLSPEIYIERLCASSTHPDECLAPEWSRHRWDTHNRLRRHLVEHGCRQGSALTPIDIPEKPVPENHFFSDRLAPCRI